MITEKFAFKIQIKDTTTIITSKTDAMAYLMEELKKSNHSITITKIAKNSKISDR